MRLGKLDALDFIEIDKNDSPKILEYKISRTEDESLILEIKMDISDSALELVTMTKENSLCQ